MQFPRPLTAGDAIAIVSPASKIDPTLIDHACEAIAARGYEPRPMPHSKGVHGSYSATAADRLSDLQQAYADPAIRAILCSRGGYGTVHLLDKLPCLTADPKWIVGFSDISALHAASVCRGVASVHASMCKHLAEFPPDDPCTESLFSILTGNLPDYTLPANPRNRTGRASGQLAGGNMAVLSGLVSTPYNLLQPDNILFIEDVAEPIYKIERMLYTLRLNGTLAATRALLVGQFTEYRPGNDYADMYDMIANMVDDYDFPVAYGLPIGHVDDNLPMIEGCQVTVYISTDAVRLTFTR